MNKALMAGLGLLVVAGAAVGGDINFSGNPAAGSGMYTIQNLYDYLMGGTPLAVQSGFQEPVSGPASSTRTTKEVGDGIKAKFDECGATAADVKSGVKYFGTSPGSWGVQTGTLALTGNAGAGDVVSGKSFYSNSWTPQSGTLTSYCASGKSCYATDHSDLKLSAAGQTWADTSAGEVRSTTNAWITISTTTFTPTSTCYLQSMTVSYDIHTGTWGTEIAQGRARLTGGSLNATLASYQTLEGQYGGGAYKTVTETYVGGPPAPELTAGTTYTVTYEMYTQYGMHGNYTGGWMRSRTTSTKLNVITDR